MADPAKAVFNAQNDNQEKVAVILTEPHTDQEVLERLRSFLVENGYKLEVLDTNYDNILKAAEKVRLAPREMSTCYIAGSAIGDDPELVAATKDLARKVAQAGFNTVYPGSGIGMMGAICDAVKEVDGKVTSIFSLAVAQAHFEEITTQADSIVVAPNEEVRQSLYHLLAGSQIAVPGGGGTYGESTAHFYKNTQIGMMYRKPDMFGPENYPSPILYFSPKTEAVKQSYKKILCEKLYPNDPKMQKAIMVSDIDAGYWDFTNLAYENLIDMGFGSPDFRAFIKNYDKPEDMVGQLQSWAVPGIRDQMIQLFNAHHKKSRAALKNIVGSDFKL